MDLNNHDNRNAKNLNKTHLNYKFVYELWKVSLVGVYFKMIFCLQSLTVLFFFLSERTFINMFTIPCANR